MACGSARLSALLSADDLLRRVTATLREQGRLDRTLFILTSDNGMNDGMHRWLRDKKTPYVAVFSTATETQMANLLEDLRPRHLAGMLATPMRWKVKDSWVVEVDGGGEVGEECRQL